MQATGSKSSESKKLLSIRLRSDGQSFSLPELGSDRSSSEVVVELDTPLQLSLPASIDRAAALDIMARDGIDTGERFTVVECEAAGGEVKVWASIPNEACEAVELYGRVRYVPTLALSIDRAKEGVGLNSSIGRCNRSFAVAAVSRDHKLLFADVVYYGSSDGWDYMIAQLDADFDISKGRIESWE